MSRTVRLGELLLGIEGAALFRHLLDCDDEFASARVDAIRRMAADFDGPRLSASLDVPELDVGEGYAAWAASYDEIDNALINTEEPLVDALTRDLPVGAALDAACGTGRHTAWLVARGHSTTSVDATPAMLDVARRRVPDARFEAGDLTELRFDDASFDFAICALALAHFERPARAIAELARVVRPGGRIVLTDAHPTFVLIQGQAVFPTANGLAFVRNHPHLHSTYLAAFRSAGLTVLDCVEAQLEADFGKGLFAHASEAAAAFWRGIPAVLAWSLRKD